jgi:hypothetical protein
MQNMSETNLTVKPKMPSFKKGIALAREQAENTISSIDPTKVPNRLGLVFDDSGSMGGKSIEDAHTAVKNFTNSCNFNDTSIAIYPLNKDKKPLTIDYDLLNLYVMGILADGGTPLYHKLLEMIENENMTRAVVFSDGSPTDSKLTGTCESWDSKPAAFAQDIITKYIEKKIPIDTIYIGYASDVTDVYEDGSKPAGYREMEKIAELTGGIFIHFKDSTSLSNNLKYLAPRYRALLSNAELKSKVEKGESI